VLNFLNCNNNDSVPIIIFLRFILDIDVGCYIFPRGRLLVLVAKSG
jgi:hypothetical protein